MTKILQADFHQRIDEVVIVGVGGTGASVARSTARIIYDMQQRGLHTPRLTLVDGDKVEERNVGRQLFAPSDCGRFKSVVVAQRLSYTFGIAVQAVPEMFDVRRHTDYHGTLLIGAVDNHLARIEMSRFSGLILDMGNHRDSGQAILGNTGDRDVALHALKQSEKGDVIHHLPNAALTFPELLQGEAPAPKDEPGVSCAQLVAAGEQHLLINDMMAVAAAGYIHSLLNRLPITSWMTFVDIGMGFAMRPVQITPENILAYIGKN